MTEPTELPAANVLITDMGGHVYRLTFGSKRRYVAITATGSQLDRWTTEIRAAIGAPMNTPMTLEQEHEFYPQPENQEPQGPAFRRSGGT